ncbi:TraB/VirB10 family protein [Desulfogranum marinum]|uniref:TraB/VirB10 family protein n=1 Tax=Desulfogranum marinum TaxID=453220 RepID=UPI0019641DD7|nr:TraB/VirB10 family protein [Desulfogranum marinum]MBM9514859.1 TraB/VirB10 family protein [Desulfogranum marinum]
MSGFDKLEPRQKKQIIWAVIGIILFTLIMVGYNLRSKRTLNLAGDQGVKSVALEPDLIQKTTLRETRRELEKLRNDLSALKKEQELAKRKGKEPEKVTIPTADEISRSATSPSGTVTEWPLPITESGPGKRLPTAPPPAPINPEPVVIGEIAVVSNPQAEEILQDPKKKGRSVYLPPSFMEASLLTGFDASTSGTSKSSPEPMLLRIQTPAVLPNDIKGDVEGCFVVAEAVGRLDKERADVRLVSLSCLSKNGQAVIDEPVKGFVTDSDSKVGLSGRVVSRMGAATARATVAGIFGGAGDWLKAASTTTSTSALGSTQTVDSGDVVPYALGGGLSEGADTLRDFYLDLARQTTPVIEVGATKEITVVISEGKDLQIREIDSGTI